MAAALAQPICCRAREYACLLGDPFAIIRIFLKKRHRILADSIRAFST
jgi:hypothetical protein